MFGRSIRAYSGHKRENHMTVNELIKALQQIADNGGGEAVTTCYEVKYWSDDIVTLLVGKAPLVTETDARPITILNKRTLKYVAS